jgi:hypothetical protein
MPGNKLAPFGSISPNSRGGLVTPSGLTGYPAPVIRQQKPVELASIFTVSGCENDSNLT